MIYKKTKLMEIKTTYDKKWAFKYIRTLGK